MALLLRSSSFQQQKDFQEAASEQRTIARAMMPLLTWEKKNYQNQICEGEGIELL